MSRYATLQVLIAVVLAITSTSLGYELEQRGASLPVPMWLVLVGSLWLGAYLAPLLSWAVMQSQTARRLLLGSEWLEGIWVISTFEGDKQAATSLAMLSYDRETLGLLVTAWVIGPHGAVERRVSASQVASVTSQGGRLQYVSVFTSETNRHSFVGVAVGSFWSDPSVRHPNRYEGRVHYMDGRPLRSEIARRLEDDMMRKLKKDHPETWEQELFQRYASDAAQLAPQSGTTIQSSI